jgi:H+/Cl- antiporter ClcA
MLNFNWDNWDNWKLALENSFIWSLITLFSGLLQVFLILLLTWIDCGRNFDEVLKTLDELLINGSLLFFSTAIVSSLTIDRLLREPKVSRIMGAFLVFCTVVIGVISVSIFAKYYGISEIKEETLNAIKDVEYMVFITTFIYAFVVKFIVFKNSRI